MRFTMARLDISNYILRLKETGMLRDIRRRKDEATRILAIQNGLVHSDFELMSSEDFENYCMSLLSVLGYTNVSETTRTGDHGVDILATQGKIVYAFQCKCYSSPLGNHCVQEVYSGKDIYGADKAIVITNSTFTRQAINDASTLNVSLWDGYYLSQLIDKAYETLSNKVTSIDSIPPMSDKELAIEGFKQYPNRVYTTNLPHYYVYYDYNGISSNLNQKGEGLPDSKIKYDLFLLSLLEAVCIFGLMLSLLVCIVYLTLGIISSLFLGILIFFSASLRHGFVRARTEYSEIMKIINNMD